MIFSKSAVAGALGLTLLAGGAEASFTIDISQTGGNVVATGNGSVDLTDLSPSFGGNDNAQVIPDEGVAAVGGGDFTEYGLVNGPASFGPGGLSRASSNSGDLVGVAADHVVVPEGYVSGTALSSSATWVGATLDSLGLTAGTYTYTWGSGPDADSLTLHIIAVPEPATWATMLVGFAALGMIAGGRAKRRRAALAG